MAHYSQLAGSESKRRKKWKKTKPYNSPKSEDLKIVTGSWKVCALMAVYQYPVHVAVSSIGPPAYSMARCITNYIWCINCYLGEQSGVWVIWKRSQWEAELVQPSYIWWGRPLWCVLSSGAWPRLPGVSITHGMYILLRKEYLVSVLKLCLMISVMCYGHFQNMLSQFPSFKRHHSILMGTPSTSSEGSKDVHFIFR